MVEKTEVAKTTREEYEGAKQLKQARRPHLIGTHVTPHRGPRGHAVPPPPFFTRSLHMPSKRTTLSASRRRPSC